MSDQATSEGKALINWQEVVDWAREVGESLAYWGEVTADTVEPDPDELQRRALAKYNLWQEDRRRRLAEYDARVDVYHSALDKARAEVEARDRAEYAEYCRRSRQHDCKQHDAHVQAYHATHIRHAAAA